MTDEVFQRAIKAWEKRKRVIISFLWNTNYGKPTSKGGVVITRKPNRSEKYLKTKAGSEELLYSYDKVIDIQEEGD
jgi:hypothetical protein